MDNSIKDCPTCKGTGRINVRYEMQWENTGWVPMEGEWVERKKSDPCPDCEGRGKLTLKWVPKK